MIVEIKSISRGKSSRKSISRGKSSRGLGQAPLSTFRNLAFNGNLCSIRTNTH